MKYNTVTETHITDVPRMCDEVMNTLRQMFPDRKIGYFHDEKYHTLAGYKLSGSITQDEANAINKRVRETVDGVHHSIDKMVSESEKFMVYWKKWELPLSNDKVLVWLFKAIQEHLKYVESHRKDDPVTACAFAKYSDDISKVYSLWFERDFAGAADHLHKLSDVVKDSIDYRTKKTIMKHYKVA